MIVQLIRFLSKILVFDYHILTGAPIKNDSAGSSWGSETRGLYEVMTGMVSKTGHLSCIFGNGDYWTLKRMDFVRQALNERLDTSAILIKVTLIFYDDSSSATHFCFIYYVFSF